MVTLWNKYIQGLFAIRDQQCTILGCLLLTDIKTLHCWRSGAVAPKELREMELSEPHQTFQFVRCFRYSRNAGPRGNRIEYLKAAYEAYKSGEEKWKTNYLA